MPSNLRIQAGARALAVLRDGGLKQEAIQVIVGSAGGPKWLILSQVGRFLFGGWIVGRTTPLYLVGSSSEACRFAAAARVDPKVVLDWLPRKDRWAGLKTIAKVTGQPEVNGKNLHRNHLPFLQHRKPHPDYRYAIRDHWDLENSLHWGLDVAFREDHCRVRKDHGPGNFAILRHTAINLLKRETSLKWGIQTKRLKAAWDPKYLLKVLSG